MSVNKVFLLGHVGKEPVLRHTQTGVAVLSFSLATTERWRDKSGENREITQWSSIVVWGKQGDTLSRFLYKGAQVFVEGRLSTRKYQDKTGQERQNLEIQADNVRLLSPRREPEPPAYAPAPVQQEAKIEKQISFVDQIKITEEDIPF